MPRSCPFYGLPSGHVEPFSDVAEQLFGDLIDKKVETNELKLEDLAEKRTYFVYYVKQSNYHAKLIFSTDRLNGFSVELVKDEIQGVARVLLFTRDHPYDSKYWRPLHCKVTATRSRIYEAAVKVMRSFGRYQAASNNCQDFVKAFCCFVDLPDPFPSVGETLEVAAEGIRLFPIQRCIFRE